MTKLGVEKTLQKRLELLSRQFAITTCLIFTLGTVQATSPDVTLIEDQIETGQYGSSYGAGPDRQEVFVEFGGGTKDLQLSLSGYDISGAGEVAVTFNGVVLGNLTPGPSSQLNIGDVFDLPLVNQNSGVNIVSFRNSHPGWRWGVTNLLLAAGPAESTDFILIEDQIETGQYGSSYGAGPNRQEVLVEFEGGTKDLRLSLNGYDIDGANEVTVTLNGIELGNLTPGPGNQLNAGDLLDLPLADQNNGVNTVSFRNSHPGWEWGITNLLLEALSPDSGNSNNVTLYLQERLSKGVDAYGLPDAVAMFGVPFAEGEYNYVNQPMRLVDSVGAEIQGSTEPYAFWPDGSVRWLRVIAQADVANQATQLNLVEGAPTLGNSLVSQGTDHYTVNTGTAVYTINQNNLNVTGPNLNSMAVYTVDNGVRYESSSAAATTLELDSPVMSQFKIKGALTNDLGDEHFDYTLRLRFFKNRSDVEARLQYTNGRDDRIQKKTDTQLTYNEMGISLGSDETIDNYSWNKTGLIDPVSDTVTLRQGMIIEPLDWDYVVSLGSAATSQSARDRNYVALYPYGGYVNEIREEGQIKEHSELEADDPVLLGITSRRFVPTPSLMGVVVKHDDSIVLAGNKDSVDTINWLEAGNFSMAVDLMPTLPASGYRLQQEGLIDIVLFGMGKQRKLRWGEAATYKFGFDPTQSTTGAEIYRRVTWPTWGRADWSQYAKTGAIFGHTELLSAEQEDDFWLVLEGGRPVGVESSDESFPLIRFYALEYRRSYRERYIDVADALKVGSLAGGKLQNAVAQMQYMGDTGFFRTTNSLADWDFGSSKPSLGSGSATHYKNMANSLNRIDCQHQTVLAMLLLGWTTTEPWISDTIRDYGEFLQGLLQDPVHCNWEPVDDANGTLVLAGEGRESDRRRARNYRDRATVADYLDSIGQPVWPGFMPWRQVELMATSKAADAHPTFDNSLSPSLKNALASAEYYGQNIDRGYLFADTNLKDLPGYSEPIISTYFKEYWTDALTASSSALRRLATTDTQIKHLEAFNRMWTGASQFTCGEALFDGVGDNGRGGSDTFSTPLSNYFLLSQEKNDPNVSKNIYTYSYSALNVARQIGDDSCLDKAVWQSTSKVRTDAGSFYRGKIQNQQIWYDFLSRALAGKTVAELQAKRGNTTGPRWTRLPGSLTDDQLEGLATRYSDFPLPVKTWQYLPLASTSAVSGDDNQLRVNWSASGADEVEVRCSTRAIVPWLNYNRDTTDPAERYEYSPDIYIPWYAANPKGFFPASVGEATVSVDSQSGELYCAAFALQ